MTDISGSGPVPEEYRIPVEEVDGEIQGYPNGFHKSTAVSDWQSPGVTATYYEEDPGKGSKSRAYIYRQLKIGVGEWTFSCIWGWGSYCTGARGTAGEYFPDRPPDFSPDAEVMIFRNKFMGPAEIYKQMGGEGDPSDKGLYDDPYGFVDCYMLERAIEAAKEDDFGGVIAALSVPTELHDRAQRISLKPSLSKRIWRYLTKGQKWKE